MPLSDVDRESAPPPGQRTAVLAEAFYLAHLTLLPGLGLLALIVLYLRHARSTPLARQHLVQTLRGSLLASLCVAALVVTITASRAWLHPAAWYAVEAYFILIHSPLTVFGMIGLARAMNGQAWRFPLIGPRLPEASR